MALQVKQMAGFCPKLPQKIWWISVWSSSTFLVKSCKHLTKKCSASGIDSLFHHRKAGGSVILVRDVLPKGRPKMSFWSDCDPLSSWYSLQGFVFLCTTPLAVLFPPCFCGGHFVAAVCRNTFSNVSEKTQHMEDWSIEHVFFIVIVIQIMHIVWILNLE